MPIEKPRTYVGGFDSTFGINASKIGARFSVAYICSLITA